MGSESVKDAKSWEAISRVERIGEILVKANALKLSQLTDLIEEQANQPGKKLGELAVEKGYITQGELIDYLLTQMQEQQTIDESLKELGQMTMEEKWERVAQHERIGEVLIKHQVLKLNQLVDAIELKKSSPGKHLGEILVEQGIVTEDELIAALDTQFKQSQTVNQTLQEIQGRQNRDAD